jgi:pimeloyl-ACP methyl ester carboxylesterase
VTGTLDTHARRLARHIARLDAPRIHLVGHSMGTLVILKMLTQSRNPRLGRVVLLAPPFHGSRAGCAVGAVQPGRWILGQSYPLWSREEAVPPPREIDVGVIAGTMPLGAGTLLRVLESPHDGVVTCRETEVPGARDCIRLRVSHVGMLLAPSVARQIVAFLDRGRFQRPEAEVA